MQGLRLTLLRVTVVLVTRVPPVMVAVGRMRIRWPADDERDLNQEESKMHSESEEMSAKWD